MPHSYCDILDLLNLCWPINQERTTIAVARAAATRVWISKGKYRAKYKSGMLALSLRMRRARARKHLSLFCVNDHVNRRTGGIYCNLIGFAASRQGDSGA